MFLFGVPDNLTSIHKSQDIKSGIYCAFSPAHATLNLNETGEVYIQSKTVTHDDVIPPPSKVITK